LKRKMTTALRVDEVQCRTVVTDPRVEPDRVPSDAPARFIGRDVLGLLEFFANLLVGRFEPLGTTQHNLGTGAACHLEVIKVGEHGGDFAVGQAAVLVEIDDGRLGIGPQLAGGSAGGIGSLQRMPAAVAFAALDAVAAMDVELAMDDPAWNFALIGCIDMRLVNATAAIAKFGEGSLMKFIDLVERRRWTMTMLAMLGTGLATRRLRIFLGRPLGKRRRLPLGSPLDRIEPSLEFGKFLLQFGNTPIPLLAARAIIANEVVHKDSVAKGHAVSCASLSTK
jgi:hypothetical protein